MYLQIFQALTTAVHSISVQLVPCDTAADEAPNGVSTSVFTASICNVAFIAICRIRRCQYSLELQIS